MNQSREYRELQIEIRKDGEAEQKEKSYNVRGYASTFEPYVLFSEGGIDYKEQIDPKAFENTDMSDVVFRIDHEGPVYARTSAGTVKLNVDDHGLGCEIDLSRTQRSRDICEDIEAGNYPKMSFAFTVESDGYDQSTHTRTIYKIAKLYDVSAVSFPANPGTELSVSSRNFFNGVIEAERAERLEREKRKEAIKKLQLKIKIGGLLNNGD